MTVTVTATTTVTVTVTVTRINARATVNRYRASPRDGTARARHSTTT